MKRKLKCLFILLCCFVFCSAQQLYRLNINQLPPLTITISEIESASLGEVVNLDNWFHVEGDNSYSHEWEYWNGSLLQTIDNPIFTITSDGIFYLTVTNDNGCTVFDSIELNVVTDIEDIRSDKDNRQSIHIYPNPNKGTFDIIITDCRPGFSVEIINLNGVQLLNRILDCNNNEYSGTIVMPISEFGTYFLLVKEYNKIIYRQKVIILN